MGDNLVAKQRLMLRVIHRCTTLFRFICPTGLPHSVKYPLRSLLKVALIIIDYSMHVKLPRTLGAPAVIGNFIPGAWVPEIAGNLRVLSKHRLVIHRC